MSLTKAARSATPTTGFDEPGSFSWRVVALAGPATISLPDGGGGGGGTLSQPRRLPLEPTRAATSAAARAAAATGSASPPGPLAESYARFDIALAVGRAQSKVDFPGEDARADAAALSASEQCSRALKAKEARNWAAESPPSEHPHSATPSELEITAEDACHSPGSRGRWRRRLTRDRSYPDCRLQETSST